MLRPPYRKYQDLHIYNLNTNEIDISDRDLIGIWKEENSSLLFFHKNKDNLISQICKNGIKLIFYNKIPYHHWESGKFIKSFTVGDILIKPIWEKTYNDKKNTIYIDPSVAFGSGFHPTTKMILESFYYLIKKENFSKGADFGCGTGILSIFAAKLGVKEIYAIDNNNLAIDVTKNNIKINQLQGIKVIFDNVFNQLYRKVDFIFGNLYYHLLEELFLKKEFWNAKYYFLSGFISEMESKILNKIPNYVEILEKRYDENWVMILLKNKKEEL